MKTQIKSDIKNAMLTRDNLTRDTLRVLYAEIERNEQTPKGKVELNDVSIIGLIKKMVNDLKESHGPTTEVLILSKYLPKEITLDFMVTEVITQIESNGYSEIRDMGKIMDHFKSVYPNQYNGKILSAVIKDELLK